MLCFLFCQIFFHFAGKITCITSIKTYAKVLGSCSTPFVLNIYAKMYQQHSRLTVTRDV